MNRLVKLLIIALLTVFCFTPHIQASAKTDESSQIAAVDGLLKKISTYEQGQSREDLSNLEDIVRQSGDSPQLLKQIEKQLLEFLRSDATLAAKQFICEQLSIIGTDQSVPTLAAMLSSPETSDMARYALERIPGAAADQALRDALDKTKGKVKTGIINSLGERRDKEALAPLSKLLTDTDKEIAQAAAATLGKIANPAASEELGKSLKTASADLHPAIADAYLMCADKFAAAGDKNAAADIYKQLYNSAEPAPIRSAALKGLVAAAPKESVKLAAEAIKSNDPVMQQTAIQLIRQIPTAEAAAIFAAELPNLLPSAQVQMLSALADRRDPAALPAVMATAKSNDQEVRIAALQALSSLGDSSTVILLAKTAAVTDGDERQAARDSLYSLNSPNVDATIVKSISSSDPNVKVELIRSVGQRNISNAIQTILKTADDPSDAVRLESIKCLKDIAEPSHLPKLVDILINAKSDAELKEAVKTVSSVARKPGSKKPSEAILKVLGSVKAVNVRCALLETLGTIGDAYSLDVLRTSLKDDNAEVQTAAVRALSDWPNDVPAGDLFIIAKSADNKTHRALALRGYVRLIGLDSDRPAGETIKMCSDAMALAANPDEKKLVLSALANVEGIESLNMAASYLDDRNLQQEAAAAVVKIAESTINTNPGETKAILEKVLDITNSDSMREQAQGLIKQIK